MSSFEERMAALIRQLDTAPGLTDMMFGLITWHNAELAEIGTTIIRSTHG